jgi:D-specific alpha-keto acid dehydrogenase
VKTTIGRVQANDYRLPDQRGRELRDMTIGVVGTGRIGSAVIERLRGFGGRVLAYDRCPKMKEATYVSLEVLLQESDVVTLHTPLTGGTHHLLNRERIDQIRPGGFVVNTGRGSLIDTEALLCALGRGRLGGAALDVVEGEEGLFYFDHSQSQMEGSVLQGLQRLPNVLITPHTAYYTDHALNDVVENTLVNCLQFLENERNG